MRRGRRGVCCGHMDRTHWCGRWSRRVGHRPVGHRRLDRRTRQSQRAVKGGNDHTLDFLTRWIVNENRDDLFRNSKHQSE